MMAKDKWELIVDANDRAGGPSLRRIEVPGGWLYVVRDIYSSVSLAMQFVHHNDWSAYPSEIDADVKALRL